MGSRKILVVDDEADASDVILAYLERDQFSVCVARNGQEARRALQEHPPDLLVLDLMLPDTDGLTLSQQIG